MPHLTPDLDLSDPNLDTTLTHCGNTLCIEEARRDYTAAFLRAFEYLYIESIMGDVMEFGAYGGFTARILAEQMNRFNAKGDLLLFDTFSGFPVSTATQDTQSPKLATQKTWVEGELSAPRGIVEHITDRLCRFFDRSRLRVIKGLFQDTLPVAVEGRKLCLLHLDCDLYESTSYVLDTLEKAGALQDGMVVLFDDFYCNRANPQYGEQAALRDFLKKHKRWQASPWFTYSWGAAAYFLHDKKAQKPTQGFWRLFRGM
ncbi:MAG: hypothetical protein IPI58_00095 [Alphaproteobacteria bacterium]|nr:MAG: hypothetical protein IPI58_00095 [Alphaproteobacteria bacterium]